MSNHESKQQVLCRHESWKWWRGLESSTDLRSRLHCNPGTPRENVRGDENETGSQDGGWGGGGGGGIEGPSK